MSNYIPITDTVVASIQLYVVCEAGSVNFFEYMTYSRNKSEVELLLWVADLPTGFDYSHLYHFYCAYPLVYDIFIHQHYALSICLPIYWCYEMTVHTRNDYDDAKKEMIIVLCCCPRHSG